MDSKTWEGSRCRHHVDFSKWAKKRPTIHPLARPKTRSFCTFRNLSFDRSTTEDKPLYLTSFTGKKSSQSQGKGHCQLLPKDWKTASHASTSDPLAPQQPPVAMGRHYAYAPLPLRGTQTLVDALRTGLHGGRGLHSAPVRRRSGSGAKRQQWSKAADHVLQADLLAAWWNSQLPDHKLLSWPEPPGWMIRARCSQSAPRIHVSCSARDGWRGWLVSNPRTTVRSDEKLGRQRRRPLLASKSLLPAHQHGHQEQCWQIGRRTLRRSTIGGRVLRVRRGTPQSGVHQRDCVARYVARWETLHESRP